MLGCGPSQPDHPAEPTIRISREAYVSADTLHLRQVRLICGPQSTCPFKNIGVAAASTGGIALLGDYRGQLYLIHPGRTELVALGRIGSGPGEYHAVVAAAFDSADGVALFDAEERRMLRYDSTGKNTVTAGATLPPPVVFGVQIVASQAVMLSIPPGSRNAGRVAASLYRVGVDGPVERLGGFPLEPVTLGKSDLLPVRPFFKPKPVWAARSDKAYAFSDGAQFDLRIARNDSTVLRIVADPPPVPITDADIKTRRDEATGFGLSPLMRKQLERQLRDAVSATGKVFPEITDLVYLEDGYLLVRGAAPPSADLVRWDLITPDGGLVGLIQLDLGLRVIGGRHSELLIVGEGTAGDVIAAWFATARQ